MLNSDDHDFATVAVQQTFNKPESDTKDHVTEAYSQDQEFKVTKP